jgi:uncharacterized protein Veg
MQIVLRHGEPWYNSWLMFLHKYPQGAGMSRARQIRNTESIHDTLVDLVGQRMKIRANMGRSKIVESEGVLMQVHPQLFILEVERKRGRTARQSYQYVDVMTGMVELSQENEPLFIRVTDQKPVEAFSVTIDEKTRESILS